MACFRKSVFSSKCPISVTVRSSYQAWSNQNVSNEKPVYNPIIIFSRTSAFPAMECPQDTHNNLLSSALVLYPLQTVPTSDGPEAWQQKLAYMRGAGRCVCEHMWLLRLRLWNTFVQSSETCSADPSSPLWVNVPYSRLTEALRADHLHCQNHWPQIMGLQDSYWAPLRPAWLFLAFSAH